MRGSHLINTALSSTTSVRQYDSVTETFTRVINFLFVLFTWVFMILFCNGDPNYSKMIIQFKEMLILPDDGCQIGDNSTIQNLLSCLIQCSQNDDCLTVMHDGNICNLYTSCERYM